TETESTRRFACHKASPRGAGGRSTAAWCRAKSLDRGWPVASAPTHAQSGNLLPYSRTAAQFAEEMCFAQQLHSRNQVWPHKRATGSSCKAGTQAGRASAFTHSSSRDENGKL